MIIIDNIDDGRTPIRFTGGRSVEIYNRLLDQMVAKGWPFIVFH